MRRLIITQASYFILDHPSPSFPLPYEQQQYFHWELQSFCLKTCSAKLKDDSLSQPGQNAREVLPYISHIGMCCLKNSPCSSPGGHLRFVLGEDT